MSKEVNKPKTIVTGSKPKVAKVAPTPVAKKPLTVSKTVVPAKAPVAPSIEETPTAKVAKPVTKVKKPVSDRTGIRLDRYRRLGIMITSLRERTKDVMRANVRGEDVGLILDEDYKHPLPEHLLNPLTTHLTNAIIELNKAVDALHANWKTDHPDSEIPKAVTSEFKP